MSKVYFISDLHIGHKNILNFAGKYRGGTNLEEHDRWLVDQWNSVVKKRDTVWVLGDICMDIRKMYMFNDMLGTKYLCLGNHDKFDIGVYQKYFKKIIGLSSYKGFWISHCPMHPQELRKRQGNIHGHVHQHSLDDDRYYNACVEMSYGVPRTLEEVVN